MKCEYATEKPPNIKHNIDITLLVLCINRPQNNINQEIPIIQTTFLLLCLLYPKVVARIIINVLSANNPHSINSDENQLVANVGIKIKRIGIQAQ
jgi:hypothetical protein